MYLSVFRSPVLRPVISAVFLERLLYLSLSFPKQFYLSDMIVSEVERENPRTIFLTKG